MWIKNPEHTVIAKAIEILCALCAAPTDMVVNQLTGFLWDEEEAGDIKRVLAGETIDE